MPGERVPLVHGKNDTKVRDGNAVPVSDGIVVGLRGCGDGPEMGDDLMTEEIEVDPVIGAATLRAA